MFKSLIVILLILILSDQTISTGTGLQTNPTHDPYPPGDPQNPAVCTSPEHE